MQFPRDLLDGPGAKRTEQAIGELEESTVGGERLQVGEHAREAGVLRDLAADAFRAFVDRFQVSHA
jgi:hypothetical protein